MTEDDVAAMKQCFYDAMEEAMQITPCAALDIELEDDQDEEDEEEAYIDRMYHDASEEELRVMGAFDNLNDQDEEEF